MTKRTSLLAVVLIGVLFVNMFVLCYARDTKETRKTLKGIKGVGIKIMIDDDAKNIGLYESVGKTDVELKLRLAGIKIYDESEVENIPGKPYLMVMVDALKTDSIKVMSFSIRVELYQYVSLIRNSQVAAYAATWHVGHYSMCYPNGCTDSIRNGIKDEVDKFINAYLSVNPKK